MLLLTNSAIIQRQLQLSQLLQYGVHSITTSCVGASAITRIRALFQMGEQEYDHLRSFLPLQHE